MVTEKYKWRCIVNNFGYCKKEPDWKGKAKVVEFKQGGSNVMMGGECKLTPDTCGQYQTVTQNVQADRKRREKHARQNRSNGAKGKGHKRDAAPRSD